MASKGNRYKIADNNVACPICMENPFLREGQDVVAMCWTCKGVGHLAAIPAVNPRLGARVHQMQTLHALAHFLAEGRSFEGWAAVSEARGPAGQGATHVTITVTVSAVRFSHTWLRVAASKDWSPRQKQHPGHRLD